MIRVNTAWGLALLSLGIGAQSREPVVHAARPMLEQESTALGETVFLVGLRHGRAGFQEARQCQIIKEENHEQRTE